jgi:hypothetical protein
MELVSLLENTNRMSELRKWARLSAPQHTLTERSVDI